MCASYKHVVRMVLLFLLLVYKMKLEPRAYIMDLLLLAHLYAQIPLECSIYLLLLYSSPLKSGLFRIAKFRLPYLP